MINSVLDSVANLCDVIVPNSWESDKGTRCLEEELWQGNKIEKGFNLVKWVAVQQSKKNGGLRVRNLKL